MTLTAISLDRLLALLLGLRYRQVVTLKRTSVAVAIFWTVSLITASFYILDPFITFWVSNILMPFCLVISFTKIFHTLSHHHTQVQDNIQLQPSQPNVLNMARYRKAVYSALWVQLALVVCYVPHCILRIVVSLSEPSSSHLIARGITSAFLYLNSTLNPFLYCWKFVK